MSVQGCLIKGFGYKFSFEENLFSFIDNWDDEFEFIDICNLDRGYYNLRDYKKDSNSLKINRNLGIIIDGMNGDYKCVMYITEAHYLENTHGDNYWHQAFTNDEYIKKYAKQNIEKLLQRKLDEPKEIVIEHYS